MITENFDSAFSVDGGSWVKETAAEYDESSQTSQFRCLKRNREPEMKSYYGGTGRGRFSLGSDKKDKEGKFGKFSIIWIY